MIGTKVGSYSIIRELGKGGMGAVYLARDTRLDRNVALKVLLRQGHPDSDASRRFLREAKAASAITHPNVVAVYEIGEADGVRFVAMEYIEGDTLRQRMTGNLPVHQCIRIAREVAGALQAAQARGVVHRDIKPENIMLTSDGTVKVVDFGLARRDAGAADNPNAALATETLITMPQQVLGTTAYMCPEQLSGDALTGRADIFALGVTLYELLAGRRPFSAATSTELINQIFSVEPEALARFNHEVPLALDLIVRKCLEKDPSRRYQTAQELSIDLANLERDMHSGRVTMSGAAQIPKAAPARRNLILGVTAALASGGAGAWFWRRRNPETESLAVLPFVIAGEDPALDAVADALSEGLLDQLSRSAGLSVISRGRVQKYRGKGMDPVVAGQELNVDTVLVGRMAEREGLLNVRLELVDSRTGAQRWSRVYQRPKNDLAGFQEPLAQDVAEALRVAREGASGTALNRRRTANPEANRLYLLGRAGLRERTIDSIKEAIRHFQRATEADPSFALAHSGLAEAYALVATRGAQIPNSVLSLARNSAIRALELDDGLSEAHLAVAISRVMLDFDWAEGEREFQRAIASDPGNAEARIWYALFLLSPRGRVEEALIQIDRVLEREPSDVRANMSRAVVLYFGRLYDKAISQLGAVEGRIPGFAFARLHLAITLCAVNRAAEAVKILEDPTLASRVPAEARSLLGVAYGVAGRTEQGRAVDQELTETARHSYVSPYGRALVAMGLKQTDRALDLLEEAYAARDYDLLFLNVDPTFDKVRERERFQRLVKRMRLV